MSGLFTSCELELKFWDNNQKREGQVDGTSEDQVGNMAIWGPCEQLSAVFPCEQLSAVFAFFETEKNTTQFTMS